MANLCCFRLWAVRIRDRIRIRSVAVGSPRPLCGLGISLVMSPANRLRHFPREILIASLLFGAASIVIGGAQRSEQYLDDAQRAIQLKGDSRGAEGEPCADARC